MQPSPDAAEAAIAALKPPKRLCPLMRDRPASICRRNYRPSGCHDGILKRAGVAEWWRFRPARTTRCCAIGLQVNRRSTIVAPFNVAAAAALTMSTCRRRAADTIVNNGLHHPAQFRRRRHRSAVCVGVMVQIGVTRLLDFHRPSEHMIAGKSYPMEAHFVHRARFRRARRGRRADVDRQGRTPPLPRWSSTMPAKQGPAVKADAGFDPNAMLPSKLGYYRYPRSLTTPPCAETVEWLLLTDADHGGGGRRCGVRKTLSAECAAGAAGQQAVCADVVVEAIARLRNLHNTQRGSDVRCCCPGNRCYR